MPSNRGLRISVLLGSIMWLASCNLQYRYLYYPSSYVPSGEELTADHIQFWPSGPSGYRGFVGATEDGNTKGTVIVFHGNAGTAADRGYYVKALDPLGYRVILAEYPGYGKREGELGERSFVDDAHATVRLASEKYGEPLFLLGESLGCGVAARLARDNSLNIDGFLLITPWDTLLAVAQTHFPWLPVRWFMKDTYDNIENLKLFSGRIAVVGAQRDEIVPIGHARTLYQSLTGDKRMWVIQGAGHNDWPMRVGPLQWREWMDFIRGDHTK
jgi:pimeloyl-ACP methyl ester carboxylesterase